MFKADNFKVSFKDKAENFRMLCKFNAGLKRGI